MAEVPAPPDPTIGTFTLTDEHGTVWQRHEVYTWPAVDGVVHAMGSDALDLLDPMWRHAPAAQRLNEMRARWKRWADTVLNPPEPEEVAPADALQQAADALAAAQAAVEAARFVEQTETQPADPED